MGFSSNLVQVEERCILVKGKNRALGLAAQKNRKLQQGNVSPRKNSKCSVRRKPFAAQTNNALRGPSLISCVATAQGETINSEGSTVTLKGKK